MGAMPDAPTPDLAAAERFLAAHARVLDRRRFERLLRDGPAEPVRYAVAAYEARGGGFGHGLEPDGRGPDAQPAATALALRTLDEAGAWDEALVARTCDWLDRTAPAEGGATFVDPAIEGWPHAPWWRPEPGLPPSLVTTGPIAAVLHRHGVAHPWLDRATALMWERVEALADPTPYGMLGVMAFLDAVPDRERAEAAAGRVGEAIHAAGIVELDPDAPGETHGPLGFAPLPESLGRAFFEATTIDLHLDRLAAGQREDGGWTFNWTAWSPAAEAEWRGSLTVDALVLLRANGRPVG
jgi:hypothetical protein